MKSKLYVGGISYDTTEDTLRSLFAGDGREVRDVAIIIDRATGRSKGFGFVEMGTGEDAQAAMDELNGKEVDGRTITVNEARERAPRPPRNDRGWR